MPFSSVKSDCVWQNVNISVSFEIPGGHMHCADSSAILVTPFPYSADFMLLKRNSRKRQQFEKVFPFRFSMYVNCTVRELVKTQVQKL